jgi:endoglucanase
MALDLKVLITLFSETMTISGSETLSEAIHAKCMEVFDGYVTDSVHNHLFIKRCGKPNAPKLLIDTHFDEIGMIVTEIKDGGFLKVLNIGGLDTRIMSASEVVIYGGKTIKGIVVSTPPHLQKPDENKKLPAVTDLLIDTGYTKDELAEFVKIGTRVGFKPMSDTLLNDKLVGKGFDNKACCAIAVYAVEMLKDASLDWDIYALFSAKEETSSLGARVGTYKIDPDAAIIIDVNHATTPDSSKHETCKLGSGAAISISATTDRKLTKSIIDFAKEKKYDHTVIVEATNTGTNNNVIAYGNCGIPTAVVSLPLKNMHTYSEICSLSDAEKLAVLLAEYIKGGLTPWYRA